MIEHRQRAPELNGPVKLRHRLVPSLLLPEDFRQIDVGIDLVGPQLTGVLQLLDRLGEFLLPAMHHAAIDEQVVGSLFVRIEIQALLRLAEILLGRVKARVGLLA